MADSDIQKDTDKPQSAFRTYASDVAKLTGKPLSKDIPNVPAPAPKQKSHPAPAPKHSKNKPEATPTSVPEKPFDPPPATIIPKAPTTEESRETVLARLQTKAAGPTKPQEPPPATIIPKAPTTEESRETVLARLHGKKSSGASASIHAAPPGLPRIQKSGPVEEPAPIHTYKSDFSDRAKEKQASPISILAAEENARSNAKPIPQLKTKKQNYLPLVLGGLFLMLAGGTSIYLAYSFVTGHPPIIVAPSIPSLIFADDHVELKGDRFELQQGLNELGNRVLPEGGVAIAYMTHASTTADGKTVVTPATGGALIAALGLAAPELLLRNIGPESTAGVVRIGNETRPFFIFRVGSYERTFAGMLDWEKTIEDDLALFYPPYPEEAVIGTSTASSTNAIQKSFTVSFVDEIVDNHDVRELRDRNNLTVMIYGYRDKETLIIARSEAAFSELLSRLASTRAK